MAVQPKLTQEMPIVLESKPRFTCDYDHVMMDWLVYDSFNDVPVCQCLFENDAIVITECLNTINYKPEEFLDD